MTTATTTAPAADLSPEKPKDCFANLHMTFKEYAVYQLYCSFAISKNNKKGTVAISNEKLAEHFKGEQRQPAGRIVKSLAAKGFLEVVQNSKYIAEHQRTPFEYRPVLHPEWVGKHPGGCLKLVAEALEFAKTKGKRKPKRKPKTATPMTNTPEQTGTSMTNTPEQTGTPPLQTGTPTTKTGTSITNEDAELLQTGTPITKTGTPITNVMLSGRYSDGINTPLYESLLEPIEERPTEDSELRDFNSGESERIASELEEIETGEPTRLPAKEITRMKSEIVAESHTDSRTDQISSCKEQPTPTLPEAPNREHYLPPAPRDLLYQPFEPEDDVTRQRLRALRDSGMYLDINANFRELSTSAIVSQEEVDRRGKAYMRRTEQDSKPVYQQDDQDEFQHETHY